MGYKVVQKITIRTDFKRKEEAEVWASRNLTEDEDRTWSIEKES